MLEAVKGCQKCIEAFLERISSFKNMLAEPRGSRWSSVTFKKSLQKVEWALCKKWDIEQFRKEVQIHKVAILSLQSTMLRLVTRY
jgi:hypothetical protein